MLKQTIRIVGVLTVCLTLFYSITAQRERNFIIMFDASQSMKTPTNVWKFTKNYLYENMHQTKKGNATVVPFQEKAYPSTSFDLATITESEFDRMWVELDEQLDNIVQHRAKHDLSIAWNEAVKRIDNKKDNYIYFFTNATDDEANMERFRRIVKNWAAMKPNNVYVFYIMLSDNAFDEQLVTTIDSCPDMYVIRARQESITPFGVFAPNEITVNIQDLRPRRLAFTFGGNFPLHAESTDSLFRVTASNIDHGYATFTVEPADSANIQKYLRGHEEYHFNIALKTKSSKLNLLTDTLQVIVVNKPERVLYIQPRSPKLETEVRHYPTLLFWKANRPDTFQLDLNDAMNDEARARNASALMRLTADKLPTSHYKLFVNGDYCEDFTFVLDSTLQNTRVGIVFEEGVSPETYTFTMETVASEQLDRISDSSPELYFLTLRARYETAWNPLVWIFIAIGGIVVGCVIFQIVKSKRKQKR